MVRLATHRDAIQDYVRRTLLYHIEGPVALDSMVKETIEDLCTTGMINVDRTGTYEATLLGQATVISSLTPEDGSFVHNDFQRALRAFVMDGEMHIFYMFTPVQPLTLGDINWPIFRREMDGLDESGLRVLGFAGVNPALVNRMWVGFVPYCFSALNIETGPIVENPCRRIRRRKRRYRASIAASMQLFNYEISATKCRSTL